MSGRFADPTRTDRFTLGLCECVGKPDDDDWMEVRTDLSGLDLAALEQAEPVERMRMLVVSWNLRGDDGAIAPLDADYLGRLYLDTFEKFNEWLTAHVKVTTLPNASGAPSRNGSRASASHTPTTRRKG